MESRILKDIIHNFLQNELKEIRENKVRVVAITIFSLVAIFFMLFNVEEEQINLDDLNKQVQNEDILTEKSSYQKDEKKINNEIIATKKDDMVLDGKSVSFVIGANADELVISDPFASSDREKITSEIDDITDIPQQVPIMPAVSPSMQMNLPPIPDFQPTFSEKSQIAEECILTGIILGGKTKNAIIKKVSSSEGKILHEESILVEVGDYVEGRQIKDITENFLIFNDSEPGMPISGFESWSANLQLEENKLSESTAEKISSNFKTESNLDELPYSKNLLQDRNDLNNFVDNEENSHKNIQTLIEKTEISLVDDTDLNHDLDIQQMVIPVDDDRQSICYDIKDDFVDLSDNEFQTNSANTKTHLQADKFH